MAKRTKSTASPPTTTPQRPALADGPEQLLDIPLIACEFLPDSPDPTESEIQQMAQWLTEHNQRQAVTAIRKRQPGGEIRYLIVDGKTRFAGAQRLGWERIRAEIWPDMPDDVAAVEGALANPERRTESPLRQAQWLKLLIDRHGFTVKDAAQKFGHTESWAQNKLGLLKLQETPAGQAWLQRNLSGEMSEGAVLALVPYAEHPQLLQQFDAAFQEQADRCSRYGGTNGWLNRDEIRTEIEDTLYSCCRAIPNPELHTPEFPRTPEIDAALQIVRLPTGDRGKLEEWALNAQQFDALREVAQENRTRQAAGATASDESTDTRPTKADLSPAERRELAKQKAEQLAARVRYWRHRWILYWLYGRVQPGDWQLERLWIFLAISRDWLSRAVGNPRVWDVLRAALQREALPCAGLKPKDKWGIIDTDELWAALCKIPAGPNRVQDLLATQTAFVRELLQLEDKGKDYPVVPYAVADQLAVDYELNWATAWADVQESCRDEWEAFLLLHEREQLVSLFGEWDLYAEPSTTRKQLVSIAMGQARNLPLPKILTPKKAK